jgi:hypothetical protein
VLVDSTAVRDVAYEPAGQLLRITFVSGERYLYRGVPAAVHRALLDAESKGRFFQTQIRGRYAFERLS